MSLEKCLQEIADEDPPITHYSLVELSSLTSAELGRFRQVWASVSPQRRAAVLARLVEMSEDSPQLDFSEVFKLALHDPDELVQERAISGLWEVEERSLIPILLDKLRFESPCRVRAASAIALGKFAQLAQDGKILHKDAATVEEALMAVLQDEKESLEVRRRSLEAVAYFNTPQVQEYIRWAYHSDDLDLKCSALFAMGRTQEKAWLPAIIAELRSASAPLRYEAACACGELGEEDLIHHLIPLLDDDDVQAQVASINALGKIGGALAKRALLRVARTGDQAIKEAALDALEELDT